MYYLFAMTISYLKTNDSLFFCWYVVVVGEDGDQETSLPKENNETTIKATRPQGRSIFFHESSIYFNNRVI